jgi:dsDNA-specific endonuclease/ATPase MutS2
MKSRCVAARERNSELSHELSSYAREAEDYEANVNFYAQEAAEQGTRADAAEVKLRSLRQKLKTALSKIKLALSELLEEEGALGEDEEEEEGRALGEDDDEEMLC